MSRLSRFCALVNSFESRRLIEPIRRPVRSLPGVIPSSSAPLQTPHRRFSVTGKTTSSASAKFGRHNPRLVVTAMDAELTHTPASDAPFAPDCFVSIAGPTSHVRPSRDDDNGRSDGVNNGERKELPEELSRNVMKLECESSAEGGICDVYLVGTAHVSKESCREVEAVISYLKPQVVFLELCSSRVGILSPKNEKVPTTREMLNIWKKEYNTFGVLYSWFLAKVASRLEVFPGSEFRVAYEEAQKCGAEVVLGDRPVQISLRRTWTRMPLWQKTKLLFGLFFQSLLLPSATSLARMLKEMNNADTVTVVIKEMSKRFPTLMETLVHERDQYMASTLLRVASSHSLVVAVVGKGHLPGIKKNWKQPIEINDLLKVDVPKRRRLLSAAKAITKLGVAVTGAAIVAGIFFRNRK